MATNGMIGSGVKVAYSDSSPLSYNKIGQLLDCTVPGLKPDEVETTVHGTSNFKRFMRGLIDVTETTLVILMDLDATSSTDQDHLFTLQSAGTTVYWRIEIPTNRAKTTFASFEFQAWIKDFMPKAPIAGRQELDVTLRFDGSYFQKNASGASILG